MVIEGAGQLALLSYLDAKKNLDSVRQGSSSVNRNDSVEFSAAAMAQAVGTQQAVAMPQLLVNEEMVRLNMTRIFMDTLFGDQNAESKKEESETVEAVVGEASFDALLEEASKAVERGQL
ncbi:MAG: hypothetical protein HQL83_04430 [Magnetococcales bacterium]|nr:hypothetical protein [Magnetococcales bacterium]